MYCKGNRSESSIPSSKSFIFLSGWPQSGTSLLQQILSESKFMATMVEKCTQIFGKKCTNWNNEGQWMLLAPSPLQPGVMCPLPRDLNNSELVLIRDQVSPHVNMSK